ncbi:MAG TPA: amidohydrolase family protein [Tahibacter sp.]|nr:amidohydrolase family protein [Tahibacter sp.]
MQRPVRYRYAVVLAALVCTAAHAQTTTRYSVLFQGKPGGAQTTTADDGRVTVDFSFRNNGRGPDLKEEYAWSRDGTLSSFRLSGKSTVGSDISENYTRDGDKATWRSTADNGEKTVKGSTIYLPAAESSVENLAAIARTIARAGGRIDVVPSGELASRKLATIEVARGETKRKVALHAITGFGLQPAFVWLDDDAGMALFASISTGFEDTATILAGWEDQAAPLKRRQLDAESEMLTAFAKKHSHALAGTTVVRNARVFDAERATLGAASDVYVEAGRVVEVAATGKSTRKAANVVDAQGRVLLPGLFDMHGHETTWGAPLQIAAGVTTVRDLGNDNATLADLSAQIDAGTRLGAHIVPAGFIEGESQYSARYGFVVKDLAGAKRAVDWYAEHKYPQIKIYNSFPKDLVKDTAAYAHEKGLRVSGHVPAFMRAQDVVQLGYDEVQHINQLMLNFFVKPETDTRTLERFYLVAENAHALDLDSAPVKEFVALLKQRGTVIDPTLAVFEFMGDKAGETMLTYRAIADHFPVTLQRTLRAGFFSVPDDKEAAYRGSVKKMAQFVGVMYRAGIPVVAGTDAIPGFTLHRELQIYVEGAGMTPAQALQIATLNGAKYTRTSDRAGTIAPGRNADLVLVDGDPTQTITDLRKIAFVMKGGTAYYPDEIYRELGVAPFAQSVKVRK